MYGLFYTHVGKEEYWGLLLASKVDLKYWKPASIVKEGLACDLGQRTDYAKDQGFFRKRCFLFYGASGSRGSFGGFLGSVMEAYCV